MSLAILARPPGGAPLLRDYLAGHAAAARFFAGSPVQLQAYRAKAAEVRQRFGRAERATAAAALRPTSAAAARRLERFVEDGGAVVTTGQQAGLLGGPLYTVYKALTAVRLARVLEAELEHPVLPVFWVASEDHDWAEVNHAYVLDPADRLVRLGLDTEAGAALPMSELTLGPEVQRILGELAQVVGGEAFGNEVLERIRGAYQPGRTVAAAFGDWMAELLAPWDVCLADAADPVLKHASVGVLERALEDAPAQETALAGRAAELEQAGYGVQVPILPRATNVFRTGDAGRERVYRDEAGFFGAETGERLAAQRLRAELAAQPGRFSPNVLLRPVVESTVFPTLAYVGGPGEIRYFAQLAPLFEQHGIRPPVVVPRFSALLLDDAAARRLHGLGLELDALDEPRHVLLQRLARRALPEAVQQQLQALRAALADGYRGLIDAAARLDPTLAGPLGGLRNEALAGAGTAEQKILRQLKRGERVDAARLDRLLQVVRPAGSPQERVLSAVSFLAREGPALLQRVLDAMRLPGLEAPADVPEAVGARKPPPAG